MTPQSTEFDAAALVARLERLDPEDRQSILEILNSLLAWTEDYRTPAEEVTP